MNLSPLLFHEYAVQYLRCKSEFNAKTSPNSPVPYFLVCRAIELELKAKHLESKSRPEVKDTYGHNLKKAYDELPISLHVLSSQECKELQHASTIYKSKGFEYVEVYDAVTGLKAFPDLETLDQIAVKLTTR